MLSVENVTAAYGMSTAISGVSIRVPDGACVALLGNNGAGKTTLLRVISGLLAPLEGSVRLGETDLTGRPAHRVVELGIAHVPEGRQVFSDFTVAENIAIGALRRRDRRAVVRDRKLVLELFPQLSGRLRQLAGTLSGGEQQMLSIARGMMARPKLMLVDEPSLGLSPRMTAEIFEILAKLNRESGLSIVLVEQNARLALQHADYAYVLASGQVGTEGEARRLRENEAAVHETYLGREVTADSRVNNIQQAS